LVIVIHEELLAALQVHPVPAVTLTVPVVAAEVVRLRDIGVIAGAHGAVNPNVLDRELAEAPPGPTALTTDS